MMKKNRIIAATLVLASIAVLSCAEKGKKATNASEVVYENKLDTISYAIGVNIANDFKKSDLTDLNLDAMKEGFADVLQEDTSWLSNEEAVKLIQAYMMEKKEQEGLAFLEENKKKEGVNVLPSGIQYEVLKEGTGVKPTLQDSVQVHYSGFLTDGTMFDSSVRRGMPFTTYVDGNIIEGWKLALQEMNEGAKYKFYIPYELGYGAMGAPRGGIPGYAVLIFEIELLDVLSK